MIYLSQYWSNPSIVDNRATMLRFMFMLGQQLVNLFPARRRRPKPAEEPFWLEDGEGDAREMAGLNWDQWGGILG